MALLVALVWGNEAIAYSLKSAYLVFSTLKPLIRHLLPRPIAVLVTTLAFSVLGGVSLRLLPISLMPEIDLPEVTVQVEGPGRSAQELEETMVAPLRRQLLQVSRLDDLSSETRDGSALIRLRMAFGTEIDYAFLEVNEQVDRLLGQLPRDLPRPNVVKASASDLPVFYLSLRYRDLVDAASEPARLLQLSELGETVIRKRLEQLPEVALVDLTGRDLPELRIIPDLNRMQSLGLDQDDLAQALARHDLQPGAILLQEGQYQYNVRLARDLQTPADLGEIYLRQGERIFQLKDLAEVSLSAQPPQGRFLQGGQPALNLAIIQQDRARFSQLQARMDTVLGQLRRDYPGLHFELSRDQTALLSASLDNLGQSLLWGVLLASLMMVLFLREWRAAAMIALSLPLSLLVSMLLFYSWGLSLNVISLSGLVLGVGLMIDNAIIVIDSIAEQRSRGIELFEAWVRGTTEVIGPLISSALTTAAVFLPLVFLSGIAGALFTDQALAVSIGLGSSLLVAIALLPVLYFQLYRRAKARSISVGRVLYRWYDLGFAWVMRRPAAFLIAVSLLLLAGLWPALRLPLRQLPEVSRDDLLVQLDWNEPLTLEENERRTRLLLQALEPWLDLHQAQIGEQQYLLDRKPRQTTAQTELYLQATSVQASRTLADTLRGWLQGQAPQAQVSLAPPPTLFDRLFGERALPLEARLTRRDGTGPPSPEQARLITEQLSQRLGKPLAPPPLRRIVIIYPDQAALLRYGVSLDQLIKTLSRRMQSSELQRLYLGRQDLPVVVTEEQGEDWLDQPMLSETGDPVPLRSLLRLQPSEDYQTLYGGGGGSYLPLRFEVEAENQAEHELAIKATLDDQQVPLSLELTGALYERQYLLWELLGVLAGALALLYFILAIQFESLKLPLIVLLEIPIDLAAALLTLWAFGQSLNLMAMIGIIVMTGIIINDSILKIETINRLRREGQPLATALHQAGQRRLRAIVITSATTILAVLPFLWGSGLGNELQRPLAIALIGGMLVGTLVSLYFIPLVYRGLVGRES
ncbi:MAG: efflux RND transporter permease subunit [Bacteroidota bacterium]